MGAIGSYSLIILLLILGTVASNLIFMKLKLNWRRRKHIICSSLFTPVLLWIFITGTMFYRLGLMDGINSEVYMAALLLAVVYFLLGLFVCVPTTLLALRWTNRKKHKNLDDVFK